MPSNSKLLVALSLLIFIFNIVSYGAKANNNNVTSVGSGYVWEPRLHLRLCFSFFFFFFFFFHAFVRIATIVHALCMNSSHKV